MTSSEWFSTTPAQPDQDTAFLAALAEAAQRWVFPDLRPADTTADPDQGEGQLTVEVKVPGLTSKRRSLRVSYRADVEGRPALRSDWSREAESFDEDDGMWGGPDTATELWVNGVDASPEQCATWAAAWFERQLGRRVIRREWDRPPSGLSLLLPSAETSGPVAVEWFLDSPECRLDSRGGFTWWWLMRRPPTRTVVERPGARVQG